MGGFKKRRAHQKKIEEVGEETIFATYIELRSVRKTISQLGLPGGSRAFYAWLYEDSDESTGRWSRWQEARKIVADRAVDNIVETVDAVTPENAAASRVRLDGEKWLAAMHNRGAYGNTRETTTLVVGTPELWLAAMSQPRETEELGLLESGDDDEG